MMLVLAMQFSKAGWPQCPPIGLEGSSLTGQRGVESGQSPPRTWWALPQNGTEDESQWSTRESTS